MDQNGPIQFSSFYESFLVFLVTRQLLKSAFTIGLVLRATIFKHSFSMHADTSLVSPIECRCRPNSPCIYHSEDGRQQDGSPRHRGCLIDDHTGLENCGLKSSDTCLGQLADQGSTVGRMGSHSEEGSSYVSGRLSSLRASRPVLFSVRRRYRTQDYFLSRHFSDSVFYQR